VRSTRGERFASGMVPKLGTKPAVEEALLVLRLWRFLGRYSLAVGLEQLADVCLWAGGCQ